MSFIELEWLGNHVSVYSQVKLFRRIYWIVDNREPNTVLYPGENKWDAYTMAARLDIMRDEVRTTP